MMAQKVLIYLAVLEKIMYFFKEHKVPLPSSVDVHITL
jgi:hypothetical protein